jgi:hypothetical protein
VVGALEYFKFTVGDKFCQFSAVVYGDGFVFGSVDYQSRHFYLIGYVVAADFLGFFVK